MTKFSLVSLAAAVVFSLVNLLTCISFVSSLSPTGLSVYRDTVLISVTMRLLLFLVGQSLLLLTEAQILRPWTDRDCQEVTDVHSNSIYVFQLRLVRYERTKSILCWWESKEIPSR